jgi:hypothetical protein
MSKKNKKNKRRHASYVPFGDSVFGMEDMFAQGAAALDMAAIMAIDAGDIGALMQIGAQWTEMATEIAKIKMPEDEDVVRVGFGFSCEKEVEDNVPS